MAAETWSWLRQVVVVGHAIAPDREMDQGPLRPGVPAVLLRNLDFSQRIALRSLSRRPYPDAQAEDLGRRLRALHHFVRCSSRSIFHSGALPRFETTTFVGNGLAEVVKRGLQAS
jgi:hypothetical protein